MQHHTGPILYSAVALACRESLIPSRRLLTMPPLRCRSLTQPSFEFAVPIAYTSHGAAFCAPGPVPWWRRGPAVACWAVGSTGCCIVRRPAGVWGLHGGWGRRRRGWSALRCVASRGRLTGMHIQLLRQTAGWWAGAWGGRAGATGILGWHFRFGVCVSKWTRAASERHIFYRRFLTEIIETILTQYFF